MKLMFNRIRIAFLVIIILLTNGCQQTPEKPAVVYGRDLMKKIEGSPAPFESYVAPPSWKETLIVNGTDIKVEIDASISVPEVTAYPVYKANQTEFDNSTIEFLVNYFTKGKDVTEYAEPTKAELEKELILAKKSNDEEMIAEFERQISVAPEYVETKIITDWSAEQLPSGHFTEENGVESNISVWPYSFIYVKGFIMTNRVFELNDIDVDSEVSISEEDAIAAAQIMLGDLGIDYMIAVNLEKAQYFRSIDDAHSESGGKPLSKGYLIKFARNIDGIAGITSHVSIYYGSEAVLYKAPLYPEEIQIFVDEGGKARSFTWMYPLKIDEKINENIALLPFKDIQERIRDMLTFINSYNSEPATVTDIKLNMALISVEDHLDEAMYVPAWFVYYTTEFEDILEEGQEGEPKIIQQEFILALNAIDGGRIADLPLSTISDVQEEMD